MEKGVEQHISVGRVGGGAALGLAVAGRRK